MFATRTFARSNVFLSSRPLGRWLSSSTSQVQFIVNAVGLDRPGIVSEITQKVTEAGGNVGESQAARLGDYFSLMMFVSAPSNQAESLRASLLEQDSLDGLNASIFDAPTATTTDNAKPISPAIGYSGAFHVSGADHPGIVHKVTSLLAKHNMNIERLQTEEEIAPHGGTTLFVMEGVANALEPLPKAFDPEVVRDELEELGDSLNCDITLQDNIDQSIQASFLGG